MLVASRYEDFTYSRRVPEQELLHRVLAEHLETFLDRTRTEEHELHRYVEQELREYVTCGVLGNGFVRLRCDDCHKELVVVFSCKGSGLCLSCTGRRMADTAARLVDDVFPIGVPVRQWVLSLPIDLTVWPTTASCSRTCSRSFSEWCGVGTTNMPMQQVTKTSVAAP